MPPLNLAFRLLPSWLLGVALLGISTPGVRAQSNGAGEQQRKAQLISRFIQNIHWPERRFTDPEAPFVVGVFGNDTISDQLREVIQRTKYRGRPILIKVCAVRQEIRGCHVLFISSSECQRLRPIISEARKNEGVLTVGECPNFLERGGLINLVTVGGDVVFEVNDQASLFRREGLSVSAQLLRYARRPVAGD